MVKVSFVINLRPSSCIAYLKTRDCCMLRLPLWVEGVNLGTLNLYARRALSSRGSG